jgi:hypothetical protein
MTADRSGSARNAGCDARYSVSNGSNRLERIWVRVGTGTEPLETVL